MLPSWLLALANSNPSLLDCNYKTTLVHRTYWETFEGMYLSPYIFIIFEVVTNQCVVQHLTMKHSVAFTMDFLRTCGIHTNKEHAIKLSDQLYLQGDVGLRPVLQVAQQQIWVPVHKIDTDQLLTARAAKAGQTLAQCPACSLHAWGIVLAVSQLAGGTCYRQHFAQLPTKNERFYLLPVDSEF